MLIIQHIVMSELNLHDGPGLFELKQVHKNAKKKETSIYSSAFLVVSLHARFQVIVRQGMCSHGTQIMYCKMHSTSWSRITGTKHSFESYAATY